MRHARWAAFEAWRRARGPAADPVHHRARPRPISITPTGADDILLFGRESAGVPDAVHRPPTRGCSIPMRPGLRSINVAMACRHGVGRGAAADGRLPPRLRSSHDHSPPRPATLDARKDARPRLVRAAARRHLRGVRGGRGRAARRRAAVRPRGRPLRAHALEAHRPHRRARRRRRDGDDARPRVREGRRACLDRARRVRARIPQGNSRRRRRSALLGLGHLADRASAQSARAGGAHEHALRGHHQGLVRRRRRPDAGARPPPHAGRSRHASPSTPR